MGDGAFHEASMHATSAALNVLCTGCDFSHFVWLFIERKEEGAPEKNQGCNFWQREVCHPASSVSCFSHDGAFPTVGKIEMTFPCNLSFLSVVVSTTRLENSFSPTLLPILPTWENPFQFPTERTTCIKAARMMDLPPFSKGHWGFLFLPCAMHRIQMTGFVPVQQPCVQ